MSNINKINILQKKCIRIINLKIYNDHTNPLFVDNKLLKLNDIIETSYVKSGSEIRCESANQNRDQTRGTKFHGNHGRFA